MPLGAARDELDVPSDDRAAGLALSTPGALRAALDPGRPRTWVSIGLLLIVPLIVMSATNAFGQAALWENGHWTVAGLAATLVAFTAMRSTTDANRRFAKLLTISAAIWLLGQVAWDVQMAEGFFAVPAPSDIGYLASVIPVTVALVLTVRQRLPRAEEFAVYIDAIVNFLAISAVVFYVFGEAMLGNGLLEAAVAVAYPIVYLATAGAGLVALLALGVAPRPRGPFLLLCCFVISGTAWVDWLHKAVIALPTAGSPVNGLFSIGILGVGASAIDWDLPVARGWWPRFSRPVAHAVLPLIALIVSTVALLAHDHVDSQIDLVDVTAIAVIALTGIRQTLLVHERGRLLAGANEAHEELRIALIERSEADTRYRTLVEHVPAAVYIDVSDPDITDGGRLDYMSPQVEQILGYPPSAFVHDPELWPSLIDPDDREAALGAYMAHWATGRPLRAEYRMHARDGTLVWVRDEAYAMPDSRDGRRVSQGLLVDTTEQKRLEARLLHDALHDPLTGLANRVLFRDHLERALRRGEREGGSVAVIFIDLDDFKVVNDSLGHRSGDRLLVEVGHILAATIRGGDVAGRQGGDEFTILLEDVPGIADAVETADRIASALHRPIELDGRTLVLGASIGIALGSGTDTAADDLLAHADAAMYEAKSQGKGRHAVFDPSMRLRARSRLETEGELRRAIESGALEIHYQPVVELATSTVAGFEALVRWRHPERGIVAPGEFIPVAEATGLIVPLGRFVLERACRDLRAWRDAAPGRDHLTMSVNVSARETVEPGYALTVGTALAAAGLEPSALTLEITESLVVAQVGATDGALRDVRALGVRLAVDDFGTGFSALEYFKRFPVQELKIDRSFVGELGASRADTAIVTATLAFASALGLSVTAEGVETADQVARLRKLGCHRGQGYLFARPMPADDVVHMLATTQRLPMDDAASGGDRAA